MGTATFQTAVESKTGKVKACGLELSIIRVIGTNESDMVANGVNGSMYLNREGKDNFYGTTKMALIRKEPTDKEFKKSEARTWWLKAPNKPAMVPIGEMIRADNPPYKINGANFDSTLDTLGGIIEGKEITVYFEPFPANGSDTITTVLRFEGDEKRRLLNCLDEILK